MHILQNKYRQNEDRTIACTNAGVRFEGGS